MTWAAPFPRLTDAERKRLSTKLRASPEQLERKLPMVLDRSDVADLLEVPDKLLRTILYGTRQREKYREFKIAKSAGGERVIHAPPKNLKILQEKLYAVLLRMYQAKGCVQGFTPGRSIRSNAERHVGRRYVLNIDLQDFFGTVTLWRIVGALAAPPFSFGKPAATVMAQIACLPDGRLPQGGVTSPLLANIVAYSLDIAMLALASKHHCHYTRYADDITFSTSKPRFPAELAFYVDGKWKAGSALDSAVESSGFKVNPAKVRLQSWHYHQEVTGLTVNEFPSVPRGYIRNLRSVLHCWRKHGYTAAEQKLRETVTGEEAAAGLSLRHYVRGKIAFLQMIRGKHDPVVRRLMRAASELDGSEWMRVVPLKAANAVPLRGFKSPSFAWERWFERTAPSTCCIKVELSNNCDGFGTAFRVSDELLATAGHNLSEGTVRVLDEQTGDLEVATPVAARNEPMGLDVGLLRIPDRFRSRLGPPLQSQARLPEVGEQVAAIGFPTQPLRQPACSLAVGLVESLPESVREVRFIQVSFQGGVGISGAPLLDRGGFVVGIMVENSAPPFEVGRPPPRSYGQAMPFEYLQDLRFRREPV